MKSRSNRSLLAALLTAALTLSAAPSVASSPPVLVAHVSRATSFPGNVVVVSGKASGPDVTLQAFVGRRWQSVAHGAVTGRSYSLSVRAPSAVGIFDLRVLQGRAVSKTLHVRVLTSTFSVTANPVSGAPIVVTGVVSPAAAGNVQLQRLMGDEWVTLASGAIGDGGRYSVTTWQDPGSYGLRVIKTFSATRGQGVSGTFNVVVLPANRTEPPTVVPPTAGPPVVTTPLTLPAATVGTPYQVLLAATGGTAPYTWSATSLPTGLQLSSDGHLTGTLTQAGPAVVDVVVTDAAGRTTQASFSLGVAAAPNVLSGWGGNANGQFGDAIPSFRNDPGRPAGLTDVAAVADGYGSAYVVTSAGAVLAWGSGSSGELGDGRSLSSSTPVAVSGLGSGVTAVGGGVHFGLALKSDGTVWAWGSGGSGQLGSGTADSATPVQVPGLSGVTAIRAGLTAGYALKSDGTVWSWGINASGQLGDGATNVPGHPVQVVSLSRPVTAIMTGGDTAYALLNDGTVRAWGLNVNGQIGDGSFTSRSTPVPVSGLTGVTALAGQANGAYALLADGTVRGWGDGRFAEMGTGTNGNATTPITIVGISGAVSLGASFYGGYVVLADGTVRAWGFLRVTGTQNVRTPTPITRAGLSGITAVVGGASETMFALSPGGVLWEWGPDPAGAVDRIVPSPVNAAGSVTRVVADGSGGVALTSTGVVQDWGTNGSGQLGNGTTGADPTAPTVVALPGTPVGVAGTRQDPATRYALLGDGTVMAWGSNAYGTLGVSSASVSTPQAVPGLTNVVALAGGGASGYALDSLGHIWAWGSNGSGQLGDGSSTNRAAPLRVVGLSNIVAIAAGNNTGYALSRSGVVYAWGDNQEGELGNNDDPDNPSDSALPVQVLSLGTTVGIGAGDGTAYAIQSDGTVRAWGQGGYGQLGNGSFSDTWVPAPVTGLTGITAVTGGGQDGYALTSDGHVFAWGDNSHGQVGDHTTVARALPVQVFGLSGVLRFSAAGTSAFAVHD